jgi:hypothetical protein
MLQNRVDLKIYLRTEIKEDSNLCCLINEISICINFQNGASFDLKINFFLLQKEINFIHYF